MSSCDDEETFELDLIPDVVVAITVVEVVIVAVMDVKFSVDLDDVIPPIVVFENLRVTCSNSRFATVEVGIGCCCCGTPGGGGGGLRRA
jgi:hypothetical protein